MYFGYPNSFKFKETEMRENSNLRGSNWWKGPSDSLASPASVISASQNPSFLLLPPAQVNLCKNRRNQPHSLIRSWVIWLPFNGLDPKNLIFKLSSSISKRRRLLVYIVSQYTWTFICSKARATAYPVLVRFPLRSTCAVPSGKLLSTTATAKLVPSTILVLRFGCC